MHVKPCQIFLSFLVFPFLLFSQAELFSFEGNTGGRVVSCPLCPCGCGMDMESCNCPDCPALRVPQKELAFEENIGSDVANYSLPYAQDSCIYPSPLAPHWDCLEGCGGCRGVWMPEAPFLFKPFLADPRQLGYSVGWRFGDDVFKKSIIPVSFADSFPVYRWCQVGPWCGDVQIDLEGGVWAIFEPTVESAPLVNADYYVGVPLTYSCGCWAFRLRGYHISSHLGDEFLLTNLSFTRRNPSAEYLDFYVSWQMLQDLRLYGGVGWIVTSDPSFPCKGAYLEAGTELYFPCFEFYDCKQNVLGRPFYAMHFHSTNYNDFDVDVTYVWGYELKKLCGLERSLRAFLEYHQGHSVEGQFCKLRSNYWGFKLVYGF